jgi:hypothetical protein
MVMSSLVLGMQYDIAAINDGFPEGVWLNAVFRFRLQLGYLTVVFQGDDDLPYTKRRMSGARAGVDAASVSLWKAFHDCSRRLLASRPVSQ